MSDVPSNDFRLANELELWVQTLRPSDLPGIANVCRRWQWTTDGYQPTDEWMSGTLETLRSEMVHKGLSFCSRAADDDPVIVGTWFAVSPGRVI